MGDNDSKHDEGNPLSVIQSAGTKRGQDSYDGPASKRAHVDGDDSEFPLLIPTLRFTSLIGLQTIWP